MSRISHRIFIGIFIVLVFSSLLILLQKGLSYYNLALEDRVYDPGHKILKPSGILGHGYGIAGSLFMVIGVSTYMARKRYHFLSRLGILKHWLEFHIFMCTLGPLLVLFHTAFKFGGLVAVSFWSMVAVFLSGIIGRFIYIQIPRSREGRELSLQEVRELRKDIKSLVSSAQSLDNETLQLISETSLRLPERYHGNLFVRLLNGYLNDRKTLRQVKNVLRGIALSRPEKQKIMRLVQEDIRLSRRIERLDTMQNLFKYWHVAHLPFALIMLIIMIIHVGVTLVLGYKWIF